MSQAETKFDFSGAKVLVMSGYAEGHPAARGQARPAYTFMKKPVTEARFTETVNRLFKG